MGEPINFPFSFNVVKVEADWKSGTVLYRLNIKLSISFQGISVRQRALPVGSFLHRGDGIRQEELDRQCCRLRST
jgi:hypothetical protein